MAIKNIVFDFFGVISSEVAPYWFAERFPEEEAKRLKYQYLEPADHGDISRAELFASLSALSGEPADKIESDFNRLAVINRDTVDLINRLKSSYRIALLSNAQGEWLADILERENLGDLFEEMVISSKVRLTKPSPEIYNFLLDKMNLIPCETVFLDDNPKNVEAARSRGMQAILFTNAKDAEQKLREIGVEI